MNLDTFLAPFDWHFALASILINGILLRFSQVANLVAPAIAARVWFKVVLTLMNVALGIGIALIPTFLYGNRFIERMMVGICAGILSNFVYSLLIKRVTKKTETVEEITT